MIQQVGEKVPISPEDAGATRRDLMMAGYKSENAVKVFNGIRVALGIVLFAFALAMRSSIPNPVLRIVALGFAGFMGYYFPGFMLDKKIAKRQDTLRLSLPDALDMMVVSVEAGLGLDQAIQHVGRELQMTHKELSEELSLVNLEMRAGKRRSEALRNLAERTGEPELQKLVAILVQTDRFGTSIGRFAARAFRLLARPTQTGSRGACRQSRREAGIPNFLFHLAGHARSGGRPRSVAGI